jgi:HPt (histidine-containing phosphotransfer) domain-containing protein
MATLIDKDFFARLNALNDKFAASVPATLARLRDAQARFDPDAPDPDITTELHQTLHTIAGSAATFGFRMLGTQARNLEQRLRVLMAFESIAPHDWRNWLSALDVYLTWAEADPKAEVFGDGDQIQ